MVKYYAAPLPVTDFPTWIANALGVNIYVADAFCVLIICCFFFIPMIWMKSYRVLWIVVAIPLMAAFTSLGWLPPYIFIVVAVYIGFEVSKKYGGPF
jgi:hypothetical protein